MTDFAHNKHRAIPPIASGRVTFLLANAAFWALMIAGATMLAH